MYSMLVQKNCSAAEFVDFWYPFYEYDSENLYSDNIYKTNYSNDDLKSLFTWKNGMRLSINKNSSLERKILRKLNTVNQLKTNFSIQDYNDAFAELSTIWKIFLLHCIQPKIYPIFDQHVYRAMKFVQHQTIKEVLKSEDQKYRQYFDDYLSFFNLLVDESGRDYINVDRALWVFGKSLKLSLIKILFIKRANRFLNGDRLFDRVIQFNW